MEIAFLLVVFLGVVGFVGWPLMRPSVLAGDETELQARRQMLLDDKERLLNEIKDLELSYSTGKISAPDYSPMAAATKKEAARVLRELDEVEQELRHSRRASSKQKKSQKSKKAQKSQKAQKAETKKADAAPNAFCPSCGAGAAADDAFCRKCGHALTE